MNSVMIRFPGALLLTMILSILPLPGLLLPMFKPAWLLLFWIYIQSSYPERFSVYMVVLSALVLDVLLSATLGEHLFAIILVLWGLSTKARRFAMLSDLIQLFYIGIFSFIYYMGLIAINFALGHAYPQFIVLSGSLVNMLVWLFMRNVLHRFLRPIQVKSHWMMF